MHKLDELEWNGAGKCTLPIGDTGWTLILMRRYKPEMSGETITPMYTHDHSRSGPILQGSASASSGWAHPESNKCLKCGAEVPKQARILARILTLGV